MDMKTTFLNGVIEEEVYIEQPQGFEVEDIRTHVQIELQLSKCTRLVQSNLKI